MKQNKLNVVLHHFLNALIPIFFAFLLGGIAILVAGENPLETFYILFQRALFTERGLTRTLHYASPLILTGLAIGISFKAGLFNMGVEGQLLVGGFVVAVLGYTYSHFPASVLVPMLLLAGIISGILTAMVPALLKAIFNVNELVVSLLMNYAIIHVLQYLTTNVFRDPSRGYVSTHMIGSSAILSRMFGTRITPFFFIALFVFLVMYIVFNHSKLGYEVRAIGKNLEFSEAVGMNVKKKILIIMTYSGALAGLGGAGWMMSDRYAYTLNFSGDPGLGWDGMLIALLGAHNPVGILVAAVFYGALKSGSQAIAIHTSVPREIIAVIQALLILFLSIKFLKENKFLERLTCRFMPKKPEGEEV